MSTFVAHSFSLPSEVCRAVFCSRFLFLLWIKDFSCCFLASAFLLHHSSFIIWSLFLSLVIHNTIFYFPFIIWSYSAFFIHNMILCFHYSSFIICSSVSSFITTCSIHSYLYTDWQVFRRDDVYICCSLILTSDRSV